MNVLAQSGAGIALAMCFALLVIRQVTAMTVLLCAQSAAVAVAAIARGQPLIAAMTVLIDAVGATWFFRGQDLRMVTPGAVAAITPPDRMAILGIVASIGLAALCQSCGVIALPMSVALVSIVLAAIREQPLERLTALISLQNAVTLAACLLPHAPLFTALAGFVLPVPLAFGMAMAGAERGWSGPMRRRVRAGQMQIGVSVMIFAATLIIPLSPSASVFVPLIAAGGIADAWAERRCLARTPTQRVASLTKLGFMLLAIGSSSPEITWLAIFGAVTASMVPVFRRRWNDALLAYCGAGLGLFGLLTLPVGVSQVPYAALLAGYAVVAAVIPDLGIVVVIVLLRLSALSPPPPVADDLLIGIGVAGMLGSATLLCSGRNPHRVSLTLLAQTSLAALTLGIDLPEARFAAVVILVLLTISRAVVRVADGPAAALGIAGLAGIPPFGLFPGIVLALLVIGDRAPWLLLPVGLGLTMICVASVPSHWPHVTRATALSAGWLPLALAGLFGLAAPEQLLRWLHVVSAGVP